MSGISLAVAQEIAVATLARGRELGLAPLAVAVLDDRGVLKALLAEDGVALLRPEIAVAKAWSVVGMGRSTRAMMARSQEAPAFYAALANLAGGKIVPVPGGLPVHSDTGDLLGAVGVSGDVAEEDEACAAHGIEAARLSTVR